MPRIAGATRGNSSCRFGQCRRAQCRVRDSQVPDWPCNAEIWCLHQPFGCHWVERSPLVALMQALAKLEPSASDRTGDRLLTRQLLYQLSYDGDLSVLPLQKLPSTAKSDCSIDNRLQMRIFRLRIEQHTHEAEHAQIRDKPPGKSDGDCLLRHHLSSNSLNCSASGNNRGAVPSMKSSASERPPRLAARSLAISVSSADAVAVIRA